jgi:hypothetical protein
MPESIIEKSEMKKRDLKNLEKQKVNKPDLEPRFENCLGLSNFT